MVLSALGLELLSHKVLNGSKSASHPTDCSKFEAQTASGLENSVKVKESNQAYFLQAKHHRHDGCNNLRFVSHENT